MGTFDTFLRLLPRREGPPALVMEKHIVASGHSLLTMEETDS